MWLQQDSYRGELSDPMSLHRYMYVNQNPINNYDLYGFSSTSPYYESLNTIAKNPVLGSTLGVQIGSADWGADIAIGVAQMSSSNDPISSFSYRVLGSAIDKGSFSNLGDLFDSIQLAAQYSVNPILAKIKNNNYDPLESTFRLMHTGKSYVLSQAFCVGDEEYFHDGQTFVDDLFPGLTNIGNATNPDTNYLEKGYLFGRTAGDIVDIITVLQGIKSGINSFRHKLPQSSVEHILRGNFDSQGRFLGGMHSYKEAELAIKSDKIKAGVKLADGSIMRIDDLDIVVKKSNGTSDIWVYKYDNYSGRFRWQRKSLFPESWTEDDIINASRNIFISPTDSTSKFDTFIDKLIGGSKGVEGQYRGVTLQGYKKNITDIVTAYPITQ